MPQWAKWTKRSPRHTVSALRLWSRLQRHTDVAERWAVRLVCLCLSEVTDWHSSSSRASGQACLQLSCSFTWTCWLNLSAHHYCSSLFDKICMWSMLSVQEHHPQSWFRRTGEGQPASALPEHTVAHTICHGTSSGTCKPPEFTHVHTCSFS